MDIRYTFSLGICFLMWLACVAWYFWQTNKEIKQAHMEVSNNIEILHIALKHSKQPVFEYDQKSGKLTLKTEFPNPLFWNVSESMTPEEIVDREIIAPHSIRDFMKLFAAIKTQQSAQADIQINNGWDTIWCRLYLHNVYESQKISGTVGFLEDITELKKIEQQSKQKQELQDALIAKALLVAKVDLESARLLELGGQETEIPYTEFLEKEILCRVCTTERQTVAKELSLENMVRKFQKGIDTVDNQFMMKLDGKLKWVSGIGYCHPSMPSKMILILRDIDQKKRRELVLQQQAERDGLTGLYNAATTKRKIEEALAYGYMTDEKQVLVLLDLDNYKEINDTFGHSCGDQVLVEVSQMMQQNFRSSDIIGRIGGDEFVIFLRNIRSYEHAESLIQNVCEKIHKTYLKEDKKVTLSASAGITWVPVDGRTYTELYQKSDTALYEVKRNTKNGYKHYGDERHITE